MASTISAAGVERVVEAGGAVDELAGADEDWGAGVERHGGQGRNSTLARRTESPAQAPS